LFIACSDTRVRARHMAVFPMIRSPVHDYIYRASGRVAGSFPGVVEIRRRLAEMEFVQVQRYISKEISPKSSDKSCGRVRLGVGASLFILTRRWRHAA